MGIELALYLVVPGALLFSLAALHWAAKGGPRLRTAATARKLTPYACASVVLCASLGIWATLLTDTHSTLAYVMAFAALLALAFLTTALALAWLHTERMLEKERRLGNRTRTFQTLFRITRGGLLLIDKDGRLADANPSCMPLFGYERTDLMAKRVDELINLSSPELNGPLGLIDAQGSGVIETTGHRKDGRPLHLQLTSALIPRSGGQLFVILRDITERKQSEEIRTQLEAQLRHSQKLEAIGTLASGIAHDFNNILSAILGNIELARLEIADNRAALTSMEEIRKAGLRAKELIGRIVGFARPHDNRMSAQPLQPVIEDCVKLVRATLPASIAIECRFEPELPWVKIDDSQLGQLLLNLCTNSYQALEHDAGRIEISVNTRDVSIDDSARHSNLRPGRYVCMDVSDTGCGIDPGIAERIFEPFFTTKARGEGTGLGLSIVHSIVLGHDGAITFDSKPRVGTTFHVFLPAVHAPAKSEQSTVANAAPAPPTASGRQHILYVDDEEPLVFLTTRLLERQGYRVTGLTDAKVALAAFLAASDEFDLFITDQSMPGMRGIDLAKEVLQKKPGTQIILVSGYLRPEEVEEARAVGVREVILKPNSVDELAAAVHRIMSTQQ